MLPIEKIMKIFIPLTLTLSPEGRGKCEGNQGNEGNGNSFKTEIITDFFQFTKLREEWNALLDKTNNRNPFLHHEWLSSWWKAYGKDKELFVICVSENEKLIGLIPLMRYKTKFLGLPMEILGFISNHWVGLDFIGLETDLPKCLEALRRCVLKENKIAVLSYFKENSRNLELMKKNFSNGSIKPYLTQKYATYIQAQGTWQDYLKSRSHNFRHVSKKKLKSAQEWGTISFDHLTKDINIEQVLRELKEISSHSWQGKKGVAVLSTQEGETFYEELLKEWVPQGIVDISFLRINDKAIAYNVGFNVSGHLYLFDTAYHEDFKKISAGSILNNFFIEDLFKNGFKVIDFGYMADYKQSLTENVANIYDVTLFPNSPKGKVLRAANRLKNYYQAKYATK